MGEIAIKALRIKLGIYEPHCIIHGGKAVTCNLTMFNDIAGSTNCRHQDVPARQVRRREALPGAGGLRPQGPGTLKNYGEVSTVCKSFR